MMEINQITGNIIACTIEVHTFIGTGLLESSYEEFLVFELQCAESQVKRQNPLPVIYEEIKLDGGFRIDIWVENNEDIEL